MGSSIAVAIALSGAARGQTPDSDAERLFQQGRKLLDAKRIDEACDALTKSERLEPAIGTLGLLAACHEQQGRVATAWREYGETARRAHVAHDPREAYAAQRAAQLRTSLPSLKIVARGNEPGLAITRNGEPVRPEELGQPIVVDPGPCEIVATAAGHPTYRASVMVAAGRELDVTIPALDEAAPGAPSAVSSPPSAGAQAPARGAPSPGETPAGGGAARTAAFVTGGVGLVGLGVWGVAGALGLAARHDAPTDCNVASETCSSTASVDAARENTAKARTLFNVATVGLITGGVALITGIVLFAVSGPSRGRSAGNVSSRRPARGVARNNALSLEFN